MPLYAGIDLGTTFTAAAVSRGGKPEMVTLGSRSTAIPSAVLIREDGSILTGEVARRRGMEDPTRLAVQFKRRVGDPAPLRLGGSPVGAHVLLGKLLRWVVEHIEDREGERLHTVAVTHPANWGAYKQEYLSQAISWAEIERAITLTEPEAAAIHYSSTERVAPGTLVAVYDLGGGTFDAAVLRKTEDGFVIAGEPQGVEQLGGIDFDETLFQHVMAELGDTVDRLDPDDPAVANGLHMLRAAVTEAKIDLSTDTQTSIPVALPGLHTSVRITRSEFEAAIRPAINDTVEALGRALRAAGVDAAELSRVLLVGGSSRIPLVAQTVTAALGRPVAIDADPKHAIALGAAIAAGGGVEATGGAPVAAAPAPEPTEPPQAESGREPEPLPRHEPAASAAAATTDGARLPPRILAVGAFVAVAAIVLAVVLMSNGGDGSAGDATAAAAAPTSAAPPTTASTGSSTLPGADEVARSVGEQGFFIDEGLPTDTAAIAADVSRASDGGVRLGVVLLLGEPAGGSITFAEAVLDEFGNGTILVLSSASEGMASTEFGSTEIETALDRGFVAAENELSGNGDEAYVDAVVSSLLGNEAVSGTGIILADVTAPEQAEIPTVSCAAMCATIDSILIGEDTQEIAWTAAGFSPDVTGFHAHFYWGDQPAAASGNNAGDFGEAVGDWELTDDQPFVSGGLTRPSNKPAGADTVCVTVADSGHDVVDPSVEDCAPLPDLVTEWSFASTDADVISTSVGFGGSGRPLVAWIDAAGAASLTACDDTACSSMRTLLTLEGDSTTFALAPPGDTPVGALVGSGGVELLVCADAECGSFSVPGIDPVRARDAAITRTDTGDLVIAYLTEVGDVRVAVCSEPCDTPAIAEIASDTDPGAGLGGFIDVAIVDGLPMITYLDGGLAIANCLDPFCNTATAHLADPAESGSPSGPRLAAAADGSASVAYVDEPTNLTVLGCFDAACTASRTGTPLFGVGISTDVVVGSTGYPTVVANSALFSEIGLETSAGILFCGDAACSAAAFVTLATGPLDAENLPDPATTGWVGLGISAAIGDDGLVVAYRGQDGELVVARPA